MKSKILTWVTGKPQFPRAELLPQITLIVLLVLVLFATSASAAPLVYVVTASQQFGTVDLANGHFQPIGNATPDVMANLVWWHGSLLSLTTTGADAGSLAKINPATGEVTDIGPTGLGFNAFDLAEIRAKLYLTDFSNNLYSVDPASGVATTIAAIGMPPDPNIPFTFNDDGTFNLCDEGLYGIAGKLYATFDSFAIDPAQTPPPIVHEYVSPSVYQVDALTGSTKVIAKKTDWQLSAIVEADGRVYAFKAVIDGFDWSIDVPIAHAELVTLDLATGKTKKLTDIDHSVGPIFGAAPVRRNR